ncbi:type II secretion system protein [Desulforamulus ruminis]|uniref:N-terminal methylation n=1 Tax=Desulforamulus ruminis (strain ATCC 23193 / DSM 2154 / NCIMB 8452 / DL) TaxID=696281 RepID=F6DUD5_DESRL|nr:prepilin-type N-terminal cleavage/methylation domain-containing protein [Desulforamulus ruminis]AEG61320.1 N-terminal methylation [Desulforamulus ruminis DSM 2154]
MLKRRIKNQKGFTLVELLVVIAIIGILAAVIAPNAFKAVEKGKVAAAEADFKAIKSAALNYYTDTGVWPVDGADSDGFIRTSDVDGWNGPYLERWPSRNPWGGDYNFRNGVPVSDTSISNHYKYLELDDLTTDARSRLEADLDGGTASGTTGVVRYNGDTATTVYLVISTE